jgi:hypothetical protein
MNGTHIKDKKSFKIGQLVRRGDSARFHHPSDGLFLVLGIEWDSHYTGWWTTILSQEQGDVYQTWASNLEVAEKRDVKEAE